MPLFSSPVPQPSLMATGHAACSVPTFSKQAPLVFTGLADPQTAVWFPMVPWCPHSQPEEVWSFQIGEKHTFAFDCCCVHQHMLWDPDALETASLVPVHLPHLCLGNPFPLELLSPNSRPQMVAFLFFHVPVACVHCCCMPPCPSQSPMVPKQAPPVSPLVPNFPLPMSLKISLHGCFSTWRNVAWHAPMSLPNPPRSQVPPMSPKSRP